MSAVETEPNCFLLAKMHRFSFLFLVRMLSFSRCNNEFKSSLSLFCSLVFPTYRIDFRTLGQVIDVH